MEKLDHRSAVYPTPIGCRVRWMVVVLLGSACAEEERPFSESTPGGWDNLPPMESDCDLCFVDVSSRAVFLKLQSPNLNQYSNLVLHGWDGDDNHFTYTVPTLTNPPAETWFTLPGSGSLMVVSAGLSGSISGEAFQFAVPVVP